MTKASNQCLEMLKLFHEWRSGTAAKVQNKRSVFLLKSKETCLGEIFTDDVTIWRVTIQICFSEHMRKRPFILHLRCTNVYTVFFQSSSFRYDSDMIARNSIMCDDPETEYTWSFQTKSYATRRRKGLEAQQARGHQCGNAL